MFSVISAMYAAVLLGICAISKQPVAVLIVVRHHSLSGFFFPWDCVWSNEVYTYYVPGVVFIMFGWKLAIFLISCFGSLACWELLTHVVDCGVKAFPVKMLTYSILCVGLSRIFVPSRNSLWQY